MKLGLYKYRVLTNPGHPVKVFEDYNVKVEILDDSYEKQYRVKLLGYHKDGRAPGTEIIVYKKSVVFPKRVELPKPGPRPDHYQDPYKD